MDGEAKTNYYIFKKCWDNKHGYALLGIKYARKGSNTY